MKKDSRTGVVEDIVVGIPTGLHVRPAGDLVQAIEKMHADVSLECRGERVNAKSIMGILTLAAEQGTIVRVFADGPDAPRAVEAVRRVLTNGPKPD